MLQFLQNAHRDLLERARELEIPLDSFDTIYEIDPNAALKALIEIIKTRGKKDDVKIDYLQLFKETYGEHIDTASQAYDMLITDVQEFAKIYGIRIIIDPDTDEFVRLGRAKRGSKMRPGRDLAILYQYLKDNAMSTEIRVRASEQDKDEYAEILPSGEVKTKEGKVFKALKQWTTDVFRRGIERGTRKTLVGSPWKAVQIKEKRGSWVPIDRLWNEAVDEDEIEDE